ncbi:hypothetical protein PGT21_029646 [Puccinia graminis f. sp. tritici]|uniref:DNA-directed RNA polymerase III subunit RPC4 n=1 Tax=Puccinia graminis f. sp. tritici TaxID=56615 RepID=A0A5B0Q4M7_PUCGR|nr:hypothetical protein PGT21_029646 [Puccinia graminis f. sp. tritici]KAA1108037.1 hypothetical protein PGTUg99_025272 [Puccinia graminis f. sp. tritici]
MPPRGTRGRGRGRGRAEPVEEPQKEEAVLDPILSRLTTDVSVDEANGQGSTSMSKPTGPSGDPGGSKPAATAKFKPRMVKRVAKVEEPDEAEELEKTAGYGSGRGGRGRGRGGADRGGRGRPEMVMTASGAFGMGPAEASVRRTVQGPSRSGMRKIDNSIVPTDERSTRPGTTADRSGTTTPWDGGPGEMLELYSDIDEPGSQDGEDLVDDHLRSRVADLNDITLEHSMAPLSLPWDPKRVAERERLIQARDQKLLKLAKLKLKKETDDLLPPDSKPLSANTSRQSSSFPVRESTTTTDTVEHLNDQDENLKRDVKLKKEQLEEISNVGKQFIHRKSTLNNQTPNHPGSSTDRTSVPLTSQKKKTTTGTESEGEEQKTGTQDPFYIFQFPRNFPEFREPDKMIAEEEDQEGTTTTTTTTKPGVRKMVKKKKPGLDDWLGWGKGGKREQIMGVPRAENSADPNPPSVQGQIGELVIRRSGRVQMIIANVAYDVLPGAQPSFHQEIAVIDPKPLSNLRAMFVLGSVNDKFIVVPDVSTLLKREQSLNK